MVPVELEAGVPAWLVMDYDLIQELTTNEALYSRNPVRWRHYLNGQVKPDSGLGPMMFPRDNAYFADHAEHRRLRAPLVEGLARTSEYDLDDIVRATCARLITRIAHAGTADLVADYAAQVPMLTVAGLLGLSPEQSDELQRCLIALFGSGTDSQAGSRRLDEMLSGLIAERRAVPAADLTTTFLQHPNLRNDSEIQQSMVLMLSAGWETTTSWIAHTLRLLMTDSRFAARLYGGSLGIDDALHEVLWGDSPMANMPARYATEAHGLGGQAIAAGDPLILGLAAANTDPAVCQRDSWTAAGNRAHLAFSSGRHACPATQASRIITRTAITVAFTHLHGLKLTIPPDDIPRHRSPWTRRPAGLPCEFTPNPTIDRTGETSDAR
ncbi:cytochrome P450 [Saccharothrix sp. AJ9571]|nr:cytochrome P450 [Saccharothrix sp. AJ9571]